MLFYLIPGCLGRDARPMTSAGMPYFTSNEGKTYKAQVGNSVTLQCQVENLGKFFSLQNNQKNCFCAGKTAFSCGAKACENT